jgi:Na+/H+-translocating membrane pyrophosphatase
MPIFFEAGVMINGEMTYKGQAHKAAVTGDTVRSFQRYFRTLHEHLN